MRLITSSMIPDQCSVPNASDGIQTEDSEHAGEAARSSSNGGPAEAATLEAYGYVVGRLPQLGTGFVGLSAIAYVLGWREASAYYQAIGIPAFADQLSASQLLNRSSDLVITIGLVTLFVIYYSAMGIWSLKGVEKSAVWLGGIAAAFAVASLIAMDRLSPQVAVVLASLSGYTWAAGAGLVISELALGLRDTQLRWRARHVWLVWIVLSWGLFQAPNFIAKAHATLDLDSKASMLPKAERRDNNGGDWRLLGGVGERFALVRLDSAPVQFRLVHNLDNIVISRVESTSLRLR